MEVEKFIEKESFVVVNPNYPVISVEKALEAVEMVREKMEEKAIEAFTDVFKEVLGACYQSDIDMFKEKLDEKLNLETLAVCECCGKDITEESDYLSDQDDVSFCRDCASHLQDEEEKK
ncbi:hypothetical protein [Bacteroides reticulotermitis]|uniref:hypothetical protein n=1 Tax=Bacteroides reticulotermitis TaxID=1133319 RepID=UPI003A848910